MLWENLKKQLPRKGRFVEKPFCDFDVVIKDMEISDDKVEFMLFNDIEREFTVSGNRDNIGIAPNGELLRIECFNCWYIDMYPEGKRMK